MAATKRQAIGWVEQGLVPDRVVRVGIRRLLRQRLAEIGDGDPERSQALAGDFLAAMREAPIALVPEKANEQHYEVPAAFFGRVLGPHRKYSCCLWGDGVASLAEAEVAALAATCKRAGLGDGQNVLELGCGWGSLTLWMAGRYPGSRITAVSNSHSQRQFIEGEAARRGLANVRVVTCDINDFSVAATAPRFDRIVSVEMFEHLRNWPAALARVAGWLAADGRFFMHVFAHRGAPYAFVDRDPSDWMSRHFFTGGMMPGDDLALCCQDDLRVVARWRWSGRHYARTAEAWLANMDAHRGALMPLFEEVYGRADATTWWMRWRLFFLSCAELFGYEGGACWWVSHYLFAPRRADTAA